jgi:hypothetical protein
MVDGLRQHLEFAHRGLEALAAPCQLAILAFELLGGQRL